MQPWMDISSIGIIFIIQTEQGGWVTHSVVQFTAHERFRPWKEIGRVWWQKICDWLDVNKDVLCLDSFD